MKTRNYSSMGLDVPFEVPESVDEFDTNAKRVGSCLDEATNNVIYRGSLAEFRDTFCEKVEEQTGVERKTKPVLKDGKPVVRDGVEVVQYAETEADFFKRVCAAQGVEAASFQALANEVAGGIKFDASAAERKPSAPKKLPEIYKNSAINILDNKDVLWPKFEAMDEVVIPELTGDRDKDIALIGWAVKNAKDAQAKKSLSAFSVAA